jgi:hypothetical protein
MLQTVAAGLGDVRDDVEKRKKVQVMIIQFIYC